MKMDAKTEFALHESINKWRDIHAGTRPDEGSTDCALCARFLYMLDENGSPDPERARNDDEDCDGCPVMEKTGLRMCKGTPYPNWSHAARYYGTRFADNDQLKALAEEELNFLKSLLPKEGEQS